MAIGLARMMGFVFPENFNNPYTAQSITDFWRRWHMSLSRWMRDYLYISLGGNKVSKARMYFNLSFVFLISGFWHGAEWNFILWGAFHGFFLIMDRLFLLKLLQKIGKVPSIIFTFFLTLIGWVLFRCESIEHIGFYLKRMFSFTFASTDLVFDQRFYFILVLAILFSFFGAIKNAEAWQMKVFSTDQKFRNLIALGVFSVLIFIVGAAGTAASGFNPFIYFRF
jgi:alginate O-acetyltransferase complex protein AlgI